jgi:hypothetical protein
MEFAGGRLTRCERDGIGLFSGGDWPAHWQYWTVKWVVPRRESLVRVVGVEEARKRAVDFLFDEVFIQEWQGTRERSVGEGRSYGIRAGESSGKG